MKIIITIVAVLLMTACQNKKTYRPDYQAFIQAENLVKTNRVQRFRFQGWQPLDDRYLILNSTHHKSYLVKLMSSCNELPFTQSIQLNQGSTASLNAKFDSISVPGIIKQKCTIDSLYEMNRKQKSDLLEFVKKKEEVRN